jgi:hypothetical protein
MKLTADQKDTVVLWILRVIAAVILVLMLSGLSGCSVAKIKAKGVEEYQGSSKFPQDCSDRFPPIVKEGEVITVTVPGPVTDCDSLLAAYTEFWRDITSENEDARIALQDTIAAMIARGQPLPSKRVSCPPVVSISKRDTIIDAAELEACVRRLEEQKHAAVIVETELQAELTSTRKKAIRRGSQRNWSFGFNIAFLALILGYIFLKYKTRK